MLRMFLGEGGVITGGGRKRAVKEGGRTGPGYNIGPLVNYFSLSVLTSLIHVILWPRFYIIHVI